MKTRLLILSAFAVLFTVVSCNKHGIEEAWPGEKTMENTVWSHFPEMSTQSDMYIIVWDYDVAVDMVVKNANSKNQVDATTVVMDITLKNNSENDYNDKIDISAYYYNPNNGAHYHYNNQVVFVEVPAGQTITLSNYELTDLRIDRKYQFSISYISENTYKSKNFETYYTMVDLTNIEELMASPKALEVYDLRGRKVCSGATSFDYLPKGVYIINGRKYIK